MKLRIVLIFNSDYVNSWVTVYMMVYHHKINKNSLKRFKLFNILQKDKRMKCILLLWTFLCWLWTNMESSGKKSSYLLVLSGKRKITKVFLKSIWRKVLFCPRRTIKWNTQYKSYEDVGNPKVCKILNLRKEWLRNTECCVTKLIA